MWNVGKIREVMNQLDKKTGMNSKYVPIEISNRMTKTKGKYIFKKYCDYNRKINYEPVGFVFSSELLTHYSDEAILDVISHEYAHFMTETQYKEKKQGHNRIFKMNHISLGGTGETYFKFKPIIPVERKEKRYDILCSCCNKEVATRNRLTANLLYRYSSGCCNKDLIAYDNIEKKYIKKTDL